MTDHLVRRAFRKAEPEPGEAHVVYFNPRSTGENMPDTSTVSISTMNSSTVKPSIKSGELWSKLIIQVLILFSDQLGIDFGEIPADIKLYVVGALEGLFQGGRPYVKAAVAKSGTSVS